MKRRRFLQLTGLSAAAGLLAGCRQGNEKLIPYLVPPEDGAVPGLAAWYASTCRECPAGCGIVVRVSEGRARKIEGNPRHPVNRGRLCARGQAALQRLYHPDRLRTPLRRKGPRGSGEFTAISWEEALDTLVGRLKGLQEAGRTQGFALLTSPLSGSLAQLGADFTKSFGTSRHVAYDPLATEWLRQAIAGIYGVPLLPLYDLEHTQYVLSFGAEFLESHLSPVHYGHAFGGMRQGRSTVRGRLTYAGPRLSLTAANADRWLPVRPGSEGVLALGLARELLAGGDVHPPAGIPLPELASHLEPYTPERVAQETGLTREALAETTREILDLRPAVVLPGEAVASQSNGREGVLAITLLNLLLGNLNQPGGVYLPRAARAPQRISGEEELLELLAAMVDGSVELALVQGWNPLHALPPATGITEALAKVPYLVSCTALLDDTARQADLVLPEHTPLESWGEVEPPTGTLAPVIGLQQPVVPPLYDTRPFPEILLALAAELGGDIAAPLPEQAWHHRVQERIRQRLALPEGDKFEQAWAESLAEGGIFPGGISVAKGSPFAGVSPELPAPRFAGDPALFPLHLHIYPSTPFQSGQGAALPWLQELPDPMTGVVWDSWLEVNPQTAEKFGIVHGDLVEIASPAGHLHLPVVVFPGIHPEVVAIPLGQGHLGDGRYASNRGVNPLALLAPLSQGTLLPPRGATRVRIRKVSPDGDLVTAGHPQGSYRGDLVGI